MWTRKRLICYIGRRSLELAFIRILFHGNRICKTSFMLYLVMASIFTTEQDFVVILTNLSAKWNFPPVLYSHIKDHVNMVNATIWSLFMMQWHIMTSYHSNILQDVERECLNQLNACLINVLHIYSVLLISFIAIVTMANLHWKSRNLFGFLHFCRKYF